MALSKIKQANHKAKHERKRRQRQGEARLERQNVRVRNKRMRKMMIDGRREHLAHKRAAKGYVQNLEAELSDG